MPTKTTIIAKKKQLEAQENKFLAPYAVKSSESRGREFPETIDPTRTEFQRDRDRIIHSKAFRRLSGKTQVFVATYGDHFRDRLSHTLEVAQVARDLARNLRLNEDLCEAVALAHDLGHTPFGHAGEATMNELMARYGKHFEHNEQSKRVVEKLEKQFPNFDGLNLTYEVRQGLAKHQTLYDQKTKCITGKTLEAQVVDIADEIAYHNHDLDDGLRSELFDLKEVKRLVLWKEALEYVQKNHGVRADISSVILRHRVVSHIISVMIDNVLVTTERNLRRYGICSLADVINKDRKIVMFSPDFEKKVAALRRFLWDKMYQSPQVLEHSRSGQRILKNLFVRFYKQPDLLPRHFYERIAATRPSRGEAKRLSHQTGAILCGAGDPLEVVVKDYVAGCTDLYATQVYEMSQM